MKKILNKYLIIYLLMLISVFGYAQNPGEPPLPPGDPSGGGINGPVGGGAPIGSGLVILIALGAGYGIKKWKENKEEK